ncbi:hypothetical protein [Aeromonas hydrophila]|uniref:hypothetical protein n=1 Tax=Aeromonas hydrophila TaxID=644 RepID=UPI002B05AB98|nr:hypothetical protein [Aeromonas hydrophila]
MEQLAGWEFVALGLAVVVGLIVVRLLCEWRVEKAQEQLQSEQVAKVYLNGIEIGCLPVAQHKALLAAARRNYRLYLGQAVNTLQVVLNLFTRVFMFVPVLWVFALLMTLLADPTKVGHDLQQIMSDLQQATPAEVGITLRWVLLISMGISLITVMADYLMGPARRYGYRDVFKDEVAYQLRQELEAPAHGEVVVLYLCGESQWGGSGLDARA